MTSGPPPGQDQRLSGDEIHSVAAALGLRDAAEPDDKITSLFELGGSLIEQTPPSPVAGCSSTRGHRMRSELGSPPRSLTR